MTPKLYSFIVSRLFCSQSERVLAIGVATAFTVAGQHAPAVIHPHRSPFSASPQTARADRHRRARAIFESGPCVRGVELRAGLAEATPAVLYFNDHTIEFTHSSASRMMDTVASTVDFYGCDSLL
jgi:hypothetical protein